MEVRLHTLLTLALNRDNWSCSHSGRFTSEKSVFGIHWIGGSMTPVPGGNRTPVFLNDSWTELYTTSENESIADVNEIKSKNVKGILKWRSWKVQSSADSEQIVITVNVWVITALIISNEYNWRLVLSHFFISQRLIYSMFLWRYFTFISCDIFHEYYNSDEPRLPWNGAHSTWYKPLMVE
jgi:hypothetical protein